jgi:hypothetical protein
LLSARNEINETWCNRVFVALREWVQQSISLLSPSYRKKTEYVSFFRLKSFLKLDAVAAIGVKFFCVFYSFFALFYALFKRTLYICTLQADELLLAKCESYDFWIYVVVG